MDLDKYTKLIKVLEKEIETIVLDDDFMRAKELINDIIELRNEDNIRTNKNIKTNLDSYLFALRWVALPAQTEGEVVDLFTKHFQIVFEIPEYDLIHKFKIYLLGIPIASERDIFKRKIKGIIEKSEVVLTKINLDDYPSSTIENWVRYYTSKMGLGQNENFKLQEFFATDKQINKLEKDDRERARIFFSFYEFLKLSSLTVLGYEGIVPVNNNNFKGYIVNGKLSRETKLSPKDDAILRAVMGEDVSGESFGRLTPPKTESEKNIEKLKAEETELPENSLERMALGEEMEKQRALGRTAISGHQIC